MHQSLITSCCCDSYAAAGVVCQVDKVRHHHDDVSITTQTVVESRSWKSCHLNLISSMVCAYITTFLYVLWWILLVFFCLFVLFLNELLICHVFQTKLYF